MFCNAEKAGLEICKNGHLDEEMLFRNGDVGQDCKSWRIVGEYLLGDMELHELRELCPGG